jgi:hypothetical protein
LLTLKDRVESYNDLHPQWSASHLRLVKEQGRDVIYGRWEWDANGNEIDGTWVIGANYGNETDYHGAFPRGYLGRLAALFPDMTVERNARVLHAFSGSLGPGPYLRLDYHREPCPGVRPEIVGNVHDPAGWDWGTDRPWLFDLIVSDPPYTERDAKIYGTPTVDRGKAMHGLGTVAKTGAFHCWLDTCWPMHSKEEWVTVGRIWIIRSTNHAYRGVSIFQRV